MKTTNRPCPGCGAEPAGNPRPGFRIAGKVCRNCADLLDRAPAILDAEAERHRRCPENLGRPPFTSWRWINTASPEVPGTSGARIPLAGMDRLRDALRGLALAVSWPAPGAGLAETNAARRIDPRHHGAAREFPPGVLDALLRLDAELEASMQEVAAANFRAGSDALMRLASGSITIDELNRWRGSR